MNNELKVLPPEANLETRGVLKQLTRSHKSLAELKGFADMIPNKNILINAVIINEAKDSSEIEDIITTHDELFRVMSSESYNSHAAKEVVNYRTALWHGYELVKEKKIITTNIIIEIQNLIESNRAGIRNLSGTVLKNELTGETIYTPPSEKKEILSLLSNLELYINEDYDNVDPLVKLAVIHYQFESIHPFYDGNGRTGRILNILYLVLENLLDSPILYLSKYINNNKQEYYHLIQNTHDKGDWESWILFILEGIEKMSDSSLKVLKKIDNLFQDVDNKIKESEPTIYSRKLTEVIFKNFYTRINDLQENINVTRKTASNYLHKLVELGILNVEKRGRKKIFINYRLVDIVRV